MSDKGNLYMLHMMSVMMPIEAQVEKLEEAIQSYKLKKLINPEDKETKNEIMSAMMLLLVGFSNEGKDISEVMKQADLDSSKIDTIDNIYNGMDSKSGQN